jgi:hypothetical protein
MQGKKGNRFASQAKINAREAAIRRQQFTSLYLNKMPMPQIAEVLHVTLKTCQNYRAQLMQEWQSSKGLDYLDEVKSRELAELDLMEHQAAIEFQKSGNVGSRASKWLTVRLAIKKRRAELLGLDKVTDAADAATAEKMMALDFASATIALLAEVARESGINVQEDVLDGTPDLMLLDGETEDAEYVEEGEESLQEET